MLYSLVLLTVSAHFPSCLGNYVNEKSHFNDFLTEYSYVKSVQHRWKLPKFILQCNDCSSEAFTVLSKYFHEVAAITICSHLYQAPSHVGRESSQAPPAQDGVGTAGSLVHGRTCSKERTKIIISKHNALRELSLQRGVCLGFFFPFTCVHVCVYIL